MADFMIDICIWKYAVLRSKLRDKQTREIKQFLIDEWKCQ